MIKTGIAYTVLLLLMLPVFSRASDEDDILKQKNELEGIQQEVTKGRQKLDSLRQVEVSIQKRINDFDQKMATNRKIINRLAKEQKQLKNEIDDTEEKLNKGQESLEYIQRRYLGNIRQFYYVTRGSFENISEDPGKAMELNRKIVYLNALANFESGNVALATDYLDNAVKHREQLYGEDKRITNLKRSKETSTALEKSKKDKKEKDLEKIRRKKATETDRIMTLEQAAREMEIIVARLEKEYRQKRQAEGDLRPEHSVFASLRGQLHSPCRGRIIMPYGMHVDEITNLKSFSPGITIKGKSGVAITAVAMGEIAYVGKLRGYGNFVIINHDDFYYTTYAGLDKVLVTEDQFVSSGSRLGVAGKDGVVKFEIRKGRESLDPVEWIKIDSF